MQILLTIAYDGTSYSGWQRQSNAIAVQQRAEEALEALLNHPAPLTAASRTDAGVHALGQRASFVSHNMRIPLEKLPAVLSNVLPPDISVSAAETVPADFNPRFHAKYKTYTYKIYNAPTPNPLLCRYSAFVPACLNIGNMKTAALHFKGKHDFTAFCATGGSAKTTVREIYDCSISVDPNNLITLTVTGNGFLYNMVRIMAGTVVYSGMGKIPPGEIPAVIASKLRERAGKTMPPEGLTLQEVSYKDWTNPLYLG